MTSLKFVSFFGLLSFFAQATESKLPFDQVVRVTKSSEVVNILDSGVKSSDGSPLYAYRNFSFQLKLWIPGRSEVVKEKINLTFRNYIESAYGADEHNKFFTSQKNTRLNELASLLDKVREGDIQFEKVGDKFVCTQTSLQIFLREFPDSEGWSFSFDRFAEVKSVVACPKN